MAYGTSLRVFVESPLLGVFPLVALALTAAILRARYHPLRKALALAMVTPLCAVLAQGAFALDRRWFWLCRPLAAETHCPSFVYVEPALAVLVATAAVTGVGFAALFLRRT